MNDQPMVLAGPVAEDAAPTLRQLDRPWVSGKTLQTSEGRFEVRGVTYGAFRPDEYGNEY